MKHAHNYSPMRISKTRQKQEQRTTGNLMLREPRLLITYITYQLTSDYSVHGFDTAQQGWQKTATVRLTPVFCLLDLHVNSTVHTRCHQSWIILKHCEVITETKTVNTMRLVVTAVLKITQNDTRHKQRASVKNAVLEKQFFKRCRNLIVVVFFYYTN
jgi:hypothetical protein